jgi:hypothetical protein
VTSRFATNSTANSPGLSGAINNALVKGLGLDDRELDRSRVAALLKGIAWAAAGGSRYGDGDHVMLDGQQHWPAEAAEEDPSKIQHLYESGFVGAWSDPSAEAAFRNDVEHAGGQATAEEATKTLQPSRHWGGPAVAPFSRNAEALPWVFTGSGSAAR